MLSKRSLGRLEQRKAGFHHAADKAYYLILAVLVIALHDDMHHSIWQMGIHHLKICFTGIGQLFPPVGNTVILGQGVSENSQRTRTAGLFAVRRVIFP